MKQNEYLNETTITEKQKEIQQNITKDLTIIIKTTNLKKKCVIK